MGVNRRRIIERREDRYEAGHDAKSRQDGVVEKHTDILWSVGSLATEDIHKPEEQEPADEQCRKHVTVSQQKQQHSQQTISIAMPLVEDGEQEEQQHTDSVVAGHHGILVN